MTRRDDWLEALHAALNRWRDVDYDRVTANCLLLIHDAVLAMTGEDRLQALGTSRDAVTTRRGMLALLAQHGGSAGILDAALGARIPLLWAHTGDVAMIPTDDEPAFGIVDGMHVVCLEHSHGLTQLPLARAVAAWKVGA